MTSTTHRSLLGLALIAASWSAGCDGGKDDTAPSGSGDPDAPAADGKVPLGDENNYSFTGLLDGPTLPMKSYSDATVSWAGLDKDLQCHDLDPVDDIDNVALLVFPRLTEEEVEAGLSTDSLQQVEMGVYLGYEPGDETTVSLSQLTFFGTDPDIETEFAEGSGAWMLLLTTGTTVGVGARMLAFLEPRDDETATTGEITDGCSALDYSVDMTSLEKVGVWAEGPWLVDWSSLTTTGQGQEFVTTKVDEVMVAWFADLAPADLEDRFLDIELLADGQWTLEHKSGTSADLSELTEVNDGTPFGGFTKAGTWLLALRCGNCASPAPLLLTVVVPFAG